jgi:predicted amidohydrolase YtcJ
MTSLNVADDEPDPMGGYYERIAGTNRLNGRVWEYPQWSIMRRLAARVSDRDAIAALQSMANDAVRFGITSLQIFPSMSIERFVRIANDAKLPLRVRAMAMPMTTTAGRDAADVSELARVQQNDRVRASGIKWILDGTPIEHGAAMRAPYFDRQDTSGRLNFPEAEIARLIDESLAADQPLLLHCVGDRTADVVLRLLEARNDASWPQRRVRFEHGDGVYGDAIARAAKLGIVIVQNPSHFARELVGDRFAPDAPAQRLRSLLEGGVPIALGSDGPLNPFLNIMLATVHPMRPAEAITREQAVIAYTAGSAYAERADAERGTIEVGKRADLAVLSGDLFGLPTEALPPLTSVLTLVDGEVVYDAAR